MKNIIPFNNTPTIIHVTELPSLNKPELFFGFNPGKSGHTPVLRVNVKLIVVGENKGQIKIATYDSSYKIEGEGLILEDHIYACCQQAVYAMQMFLKYNQVGSSIPNDLFKCPPKEIFENDLVDLAKAMNAIDGKRGFPTFK